MALSVPASRVHPGSPSFFSSPSPLQKRWPPKCGPTSGPLHLFLPRPGMLFPKNPRRLLPGSLHLSLCFNVSVSDIYLTMHCWSPPTSRYFVPPPYPTVLGFSQPRSPPDLLRVFVYCMLTDWQLWEKGDYFVHSSSQAHRIMDDTWRWPNKYLLLLSSNVVSASLNSFHLQKHRFTHYIIQESQSGQVGLYFYNQSMFSLEHKGTQRREFIQCWDASDLYPQKLHTGFPRRSRFFFFSFWIWQGMQK